MANVANKRRITWNFLICVFGRNAIEQITKTFGVCFPKDFEYIQRGLSRAFAMFGSAKSRTKDKFGKNFEIWPKLFRYSAYLPN